jgi:prepilin-type N-terminal cleavage/methylation domain-containing protein
MKGFTLLEMMLATALLAVLMIGVLAVIASINPTQNAAASVFDNPPPSNQILDAWTQVLFNDLAQSDEAKSGQNSLELRGFIALDDSLQTTHRPALVQYALQETDHRRWLVRTQTTLDNPTNQNIRTDLVCRGISRFELTRESTSKTNRSGVWRLRIWTTNSDQPAYNRLIAAYPK